MMETKEIYEKWCAQADRDPDLLIELAAMKADPEKIRDAFYCDLEFGTGGLRGVIGAGTNRMNIYTVARASAGLAEYLLRRYGKDASVVIGYDSRIKSELFAKTAASVFAARGVEVSLWDRLNPVPTVSFAVRYLGKKAGVMITASHNPSKYNGYKVYGEDGCQITQDAAEEIYGEIQKRNVFEDVRFYGDAEERKTEGEEQKAEADDLMSGEDDLLQGADDLLSGPGDLLSAPGFEEADRDGKIRYIGEEVLAAFLETVRKESVLFGEEIDRNVSIVYSPLNGTGRIPVTRILRETGYTNVTVVREQEMPDGHFPTCPYPNPEIREAMALGIQYAEKKGADLLLATDPDCDRVGIAVKEPDNNEYVLLSGNETGLLLLDYLCSQRKKHGRMPAHPVMVKTIVTMDLAEKIAEDYGVETVNVLTGFKYVGETIGRLEREGRAEDYIFGFEESYGYLSGTYVRDKDAVDAAFLICEMFCFYKTRGISLPEKLGEIYQRYGYCRNTLHSYAFEGEAGFGIMQEIMRSFRNGKAETGEEQNAWKLPASERRFGGKRILSVLDYRRGIDGLPKSDVLKFLLEDSTSLVIRPSGTEPKLKVYISVTAGTRAEAERTEADIVRDVEDIVKNGRGSNRERKNVGR